MTQSRRMMTSPVQVRQRDAEFNVLQAYCLAYRRRSIAVTVAASASATKQIVDIFLSFEQNILPQFRNGKITSKHSDPDYHQKLIS